MPVVGTTFPNLGQMALVSFQSFPSFSVQVVGQVAHGSRKIEGDQGEGEELG